MVHYDAVIIGGGGAGLISAITAKKEGAKKVLVIERREELGGMLNFNINNAFGKGYYEEMITGPEFIQRLIDEIKELKIDIKLNSMVLDITRDKIIKIVSEEGVYNISCSTIILATGYRERPRGITNIPGNKQAGVYTAGAAQRFISREGYIPGKEVVIFGSSDSGLVIAKQLTIEGAKIKMILEVTPNIKGTLENYERCVENFNIPVLFSHTILKVEGNERLTALTISEVDEDKTPIKGTEKYIPCDTLIIAASNEPESILIEKLGGEINSNTLGVNVNESYETNIDGIFAIGNVLYPHDYSEDITEEAIMAGKNAVRYLNGERFSLEDIDVVAGENIIFVSPSHINLKNAQEQITFSFRPFTYCEEGNIVMYIDGEEKIRVPFEMLYSGETMKLKLKKSMLSYDMKEIKFDII
ncbi:oxidoreductase [Clostridium bornimense]|uniref:Oxidoreductase n=1 Tax=Clostridium bornimense TaxID=1216932 RepID=W6S3R7_9CLOT|nr:NAD(P)/FAD-dependent oxidoreductase [Clostridium bornimense]CDM68967.1 oxidoreductase [Clostridium bornimense]